MPKRIRKAASRLIKLAPPARHYLQENHKIRAALEIQQQHIHNLERDLQYKEERIEERADRSPKVRFVANQLDATGAPLIFMDVVKDILHVYPKLPADFITFAPANENYIKQIQNLGLNTSVFKRRDVELDSVKGDVVVLNTVAHTAELKNSIYKALEDGRLHKLIWYMHEDWPEIFFDDEEQKTIRAHIDKKKLSIYIPAKKAQQNHEKLYAGKGNIRLLPYRIKLPQVYRRALQPSGFSKLTFLIVGKTGEGLKGHLPILYAFLDFYAEHYKKKPQQYRDFELRFIAIELDYLSLQILRHAKALGSHFKHYPPLKHSETLDAMKQSNAIICYSMRECLPIFVFEGMAMGHFILRNDVSGMEEQLHEGRNGFYLESKDYQQVKDTIEKVMNPSKVSDAQLAKMSRVSYDLADKQAKVSYELFIKEIWDTFKDSRN